MLRAFLYLLAVANRALILAASRLYVVLVFVFLLFWLAMLVQSSFPTIVPRSKYLERLYYFDFPGPSDCIGSELRLKAAIPRFC